VIFVDKVNVVRLDGFEYAEGGLGYDAEIRHAFGEIFDIAWLHAFGFCMKDHQTPTSPTVNSPNPKVLRKSNPIVPKETIQLPFGHVPEFWS